MRESSLQGDGNRLPQLCCGGGKELRIIAPRYDKDHFSVAAIAAILPHVYLEKYN